MQTKCPNCHTVFRIAHAQLEMADGMVRCGFCKEVFDARAENDLAGNENRLDVFEDSQVQDTQQSEVSENHDAGDESFFSAKNKDVTTDELRAKSRANAYSTLATAAWSLAILVLITALVAEYLWFNQPELLQHEQFQPVTAKLCKLIDCEHLQMRDASQIEMISRNVYSHPNEKNALMVSTTIVNHASYSQPYPEVQIDFSDVRGKLIASRRFAPEEYLQSDRQQLSLLQSGAPITFGLEIRDPGKEAITYEFSFH
jgi:predicted Zn finger-like uncharacterized protein